LVTNMTEGSPFKIILAFTLPLFIGNVFQQMYNIADVIIVGRTLGIDALAAVGATIPIFMVAMGATVGMTGGFAVVTGQRFGAGDMAGVKKSVAVSIILSAVYTIVFMLLTVLAIDSLLNIMNVPATIFFNAHSYISILLYGIGAMTLYNLLASLMRALGDSKTPLYFLILASLVNIILALLFIVYFQWGVPGSALALVISEGISGLLCLFYIYKKVPLLHLQKADWHFSWPFVWEHLRMGVPMAVQFAILGAGIIVLQAVCNSFGSDIIAGFTSAGRVEQLALQPMISIGLTMAVYTAQNYGARKFERIRQGVKVCSKILLGFSVIAAVSIYFLGADIIMLFLGVYDKEVVDAGLLYLHLTVPFYFFLSQIFVFRNATQGLGIAIMPLGSGIIELVFRSGAAIILGNYFGYKGMCYASPASWIGASIFLTIGYFYFIKVLEKKNSIDFK